MFCNRSADFMRLIPSVPHRIADHDLRERRDGDDVSRDRNAHHERCDLETFTAPRRAGAAFGGRDHLLDRGRSLAASSMRWRRDERDPEKALPSGAEPGTGQHDDALVFHQTFGECRTRHAVRQCNPEIQRRLG